MLISTFSIGNLAHSLLPPSVQSHLLSLLRLIAYICCDFLVEFSLSYIVMSSKEALGACLFLFSNLFPLLLSPSLLSLSLCVSLVSHRVSSRVYRKRNERNRTQRNTSVTKSNLNPNRTENVSSILTHSRSPGKIIRIS